MSIYRVKYNYYTYWSVNVEANSKEEARKIADEFMESQCDGEYFEQIQENLVSEDCEIEEIKEAAK